MTSNQIAYWNHHEGKIHNRETEAEAKRHNIEMEGIEKAKLAVSQAQLALSKQIGEWNYVLGKQNNLIQQQKADDQKVYWVTYMQEQQRSNMAKEQENYRHNLESERATNTANLIRQGELELGQRQHDLDVYSKQWDMFKDIFLGRGNIFQALGDGVDLITSIASTGKPKKRETIFSNAN